MMAVVGGGAVRVTIRFRNIEEDDSFDGMPALVGREDDDDSENEKDGDEADVAAAAAALLDIRARPARESFLFLI